MCPRLTLPGLVLVLLISGCARCGGGTPGESLDRGSTSSGGSSSVGSTSSSSSGSAQSSSGSGSSSTSMACTPGSCGNGQLCIDGACECPTYQTLCGGQCIPTVTDPANCGDCGVTCSATQACSGGQCVDACLPGLAMCSRECVDVKSDTRHCNACGDPCPDNQGCSNGACVPAVPVGTREDCEFGGALIDVTTPDAGVICSGTLAQVTFRWGLCSCGRIATTARITTDAFDSTLGPYAAGGHGGAIGANGPIEATGAITVGGALWTSSDGGLTTTAPLVVHQQLHCGGNASSMSSWSVDSDAFVDGDVQGIVSIGGTLHVPGSSTVGASVTAANVVREPVSVPKPCDCAPDQLLPVADIVALRATNNDNGLVGLDATALADQPGTVRLDLPCGHYYLTAIANAQATTIVAHGHTALYVGGDIQVSAPLTITTDPDGSLDIFVGGMLRASAPLAIGSPSYPALTRVYVGGNGAVELTGGLRLAGNLYAAQAEVGWTNVAEVYGALFVGEFGSTLDTVIHYDSRVIRAGDGCPAPGSRPDAGEPPQCTRCSDCANQACVNGTCGACSSDADCCTPLLCIAGTCLFPG